MGDDVKREKGKIDPVAALSILGDGVAPPMPYHDGGEEGVECGPLFNRIKRKGRKRRMDAKRCCSRMSN